MIVVVVPDHHLQITPLGTVGEVRRTSDPKVVGPIEYRLGGGVGGQGVAYEGEQAPPSRDPRWESEVWGRCAY
jgi:hypothetical protein